MGQPPRENDDGSGEALLEIGRVLFEQVVVGIVVLDLEDLDLFPPPAGLAAVSRTRHAASVGVVFFRNLAQPLVLLVVPAEALVSVLDPFPRGEKKKTR